MRKCKQCKNKRPEFVFIGRAGKCDMCDLSEKNNIHALANGFRGMAGQMVDTKEANRQRAKLELNRTDYLVLPDKARSMSATRQSNINKYRKALRLCAKAGTALPPPLATTH